MKSLCKGILKIAFAVMAVCCGFVVAAAPANDKFADAQVLPGFVGRLENLSLAGASWEQFEQPGPSIWYKFTAPNTVRASFRIPGWNGAVQVLVYEQVGPARELRSSYAAELDAYLASLVAGGEYYVALRGFHTGTISFEYYIRTIGLAIPFGSVTNAPGSTSFTATNAAAGEFQSISVWGYNRGFSTNMIGRGTAFPFTFVWTNEIAGSAVYWIEAITTEGHKHTSGTNSLTFKSSNDNFANAISFSDPLSGEFYYAHSGASREPTEPTPPGFSIWYRWVPSVSGAAQFDYGTRTNSCAVFRGTDLSSLVAVPVTDVPNSNFKRVELEAGETYYIALLRSSGQVITRKLRYAITPMEFASPSAGVDLAGPTTISLALSGIPEDTVSVDYYADELHIATVTQAPFSYDWDTGLTGPMPLLAIAQNSAGQKTHAAVRGIVVKPTNDLSANALALPANLTHLSFHSSALLATRQADENTANPEVWWKWIPDRSGYCVLNLIESSARIRILQIGSEYITNRPVTFNVVEGQEYAIAFADTNAALGGFHWDIQNCPLTMPDLTASKFNANKPIEIIPNAVGSVAQVAGVEFLANGIVVAAAVDFPFKGHFSIPTVGTNFVQLRVTMHDGKKLDGKTAIIIVRPENDEFVDALELSPEEALQTINVDNRLATQNAADALNPTRSLWWKWTATRPGRANILILSQGTGIGYMVATNNNQASILAANDFSGRGLTFEPVPGQTYYVMIGGNFGAQLIWSLEQETISLRFPKAATPLELKALPQIDGDMFTEVQFLINGSTVATVGGPDYSIVWNQVGPFDFQVIATNQHGVQRKSVVLNLLVLPGNDNYATAAEIPSTAWEMTQTNTMEYATLEPGEPTPGFDATLWWKWTPAYAGRVTIQGDRAYLPQEIIVTKPAPLSEITNILTPIQKGWEFYSTPGQTYYIRIGGGSDRRGAIWRFHHETIRLAVPQRNPDPPFTVQVLDSNTDETFEALQLFVNGEPFGQLTPPEFKLDWSPGSPGLYVLSAVGTNNFGEVRRTEPVESPLGETNNFFADARPLGRAGMEWAGSGNLVYTSLEEGELLWYPEAIGSIWFKWIPNVTGNFTVRFQSGGVNIVGRSSFYQGSALSNLQRIVPTFIGNSLTAALTKDQEYYFVITTTDRANESFQFTITGPPTNDLFVDALPISGNGAIGNLLGASTEPGELLWYPEARGSVWFKWVPNVTGNFTVRFQSGGVNIAGRSSFYKGSALSNLQRIVPTFAANSLITPLKKDQEYYFVITTMNRANESFQFAITGPPANDLLENSTILNGATPIFAGDTISSSQEIEERQFVPGWINAGSVWYQWTAPETGNAAFLIDSAPGALAIMVFSGTAWSNAIWHFPYTPVVGWPGGLPMRVVKGTTYSFALYGDPGPFVGHISITPISAPPNDFKRDAILLQGNTVRVTESLTNSTLEVGERSFTSNMGTTFGGSIWYRWIAPSHGDLRFWVDNQADFGTAGLHVLATPNTNDLSDRIVVFAGQEYYFQVSCPQNAPQLATFNLQFTAQNVPSNDSFANALPISPLPYNFQGNLLWATTEANEPMGMNPRAASGTVWWSFTPTQSGALSLEARSSNPSGSPWYPSILVFRGSQLESLELLSESPLNSVVVSPNEEYRIQVQAIANGGIPGVYSLEARFHPESPNDMFDDRIILRSPSASVQAYIVSPTVELGEPLEAPSVNGTLWWSWTAPADGRLQVIPHWDISAQAAASLAVYSGESIGELTRLGSSGPLWLKARQGDTYHIQVFPRSTNALEQTGFDLNFFAFGPATNDNFADAAPLDGFARSTIGATRELGEPIHRAGGPNKSLWWKFSSGENRVAASIRKGDGMATNYSIAIYQGVSVNTLQLVAKDDAERVFFSPFAGETYYIACEMPESEIGDVNITLHPGRPTTIAKTIPANLIENPSFEILDGLNWASWALTDVGGVVNEIAPDGSSYVFTWHGRFHQDIATQPDEKYRLRFVFSPGLAYGDSFRISFGGSAIGKTPFGPRGWQPAEFVVTASAQSSRLEFQGIGEGGAIDQVSLVPLNEPPVLVTPPNSIAVFQGSLAHFHAGVTGADPLFRQWYFNEEPIPGATDASLIFPIAALTNQGSYHLIASNAFGRIETPRVTLTVERALSPQIILQPASDQLSPGQYYVLQAAAVGTPPLHYQWLKGSVEIEGATNATLTFPSFSLADAGSYYLQVSNTTESVASLGANLSLLENPSTGGGIIWFANMIGPRPENIIPVFDIDGLTRIAGSSFLAQLYAGSNPDSLRPVGNPRPFQAGFFFGAWRAQSVVLPHIPPLAEAYVQVRVWQASGGPSYESARARGEKFGRSEIMRLIAGEPHNPPAVQEGASLSDLKSFRLNSGLPNFITGHLSLVESRPEGGMTWKITGAAGFRYLVERQTNNGQWLPLVVLLNQTGSVIFSDTADPNSSIQIYRARMLD